MVALGIPLAGLAAEMGSPLLAVAYDVVLVLVAYVSTLLAPSVQNLRLKRRFDPVLSVRVANKVTLLLENEGAEPIRGLLRDEPPPSFGATQKEFRVQLEPDRPIELSYSLTPFERGGENFRGTMLRLDCPLGLAVRQIKLNTEEPVRVYPNVLALREFDLLKQQGRLKDLGIRRSRARGLGTEFESLREYTEGDDYRKIDWKASARKGGLVVRQFEQERNQAIIVCIDIGRHMLSEVNGVRKLDHVLDSLLMLVNAAAMAGDLVGLLVYSDTVRRYIPPRKGRSQVGVIIEASHDLIAEPVQSDPGAAFAYLASRWNRRSLLVGFTDYEDEDQARELLKAFGPMARRHVAMIARVQDPRLDEVLVKRTETTQDMYQKAAASMLMEDRRTASTIISSAGIHNVEAEPQDLAAALVNFYFMVKERSLL